MGTLMAWPCPLPLMPPTGGVRPWLVRATRIPASALELSQRLSLKRAIHISFKMEILEHEEEKTFVKVGNRWKNSMAALKSRFSNQTKLRQFVRRIFGRTFYEGSRYFKRFD
ncbi:hypothetical protein AVEN_264205-1 [Araneus ventricosus]|uniref:Uncharacterized protein n=1 Tax=Araneus ventricosus TaxID=182803 RepID=A0A4Y2MN61_ARAVE|nr:hypothetical protein AVEN_264205-1 [Araneus ventricosus]